METLNINEATNPEAIEIHLINKLKALNNSDKLEFTDEHQEFLVKFMLMNETLQIPLSEKKQIPLLMVIEQRIEHCFDFTFYDDKPLLYLTIIAKTPGKAIMYLWYLQYWTTDRMEKEIDFLTFCQKIFPWGFFKDEDMEKIWYEMKVDTQHGTANLVDCHAAGKSLFPKET